MAKRLILIDVEEEIEKLVELELDPFDFKMYFLIRKNMDKVTKLAGDSYRLCRNTLVHEMRTSRPRGSTKPPLKVTLQMVRDSIERLGKAGMIITKSVNIKNDKRLILELPNAFGDESKFFRKTRGRTAELQPQENVDFIGLDEPGRTDEEPRRKTRYQYINNKNNNNSNELLLQKDCAKNNRKEKSENATPPYIQQFIDFKIIETNLKTAEEEGISDPFKYVEEFKEHFIARPKRAKEITRPDLAFNNWLRNKRNWSSTNATQTYSSGHQPKANPKSYISDYAEKLAESDRRIIEKLHRANAAEGESLASEDESDVWTALADFKR